ncbi:MAG: hypothetical protein JNM56_19990 [Planctomycetia bacterium]|nr:hypothetical protein [Planctomycetia bacterium]
MSENRSRTWALSPAKLGWGTAYCRQDGYTPAYLYLDGRCRLVQRLIRTIVRHQNAGLSRRERRAGARCPRIAGIVAADGVAVALDGHHCEVVAAQWAPLHLDAQVQQLAPDVGAILRLDLPAPWFYVAVVVHDRFQVTVCRDLADLERVLGQAGHRSA